MFNKLIFYLKKPRVVIVTGSGRSCAAEAIFRVLRRYFQVRKITDDSLPWVEKNEILIFESEIKDFKQFKFLVKKSRLSLLVVTHVGEYHPDREFFAGDIAKTSEVRKLAELLPARGYLILNFDDETVRDVKSISRAHSLTFGFGRRADIRATDIVLTPPTSKFGVGVGTNFKINYKGNIVPVWLEKLFGKAQIYAALGAVGAGEVLDLNLVEISEALKSYQGFAGKMQLVKGVKNSWILDDSRSSTPLSMLEGLEILRKIEAKGRKIAVLGDILGVGKYTIESHEAVGEKVRPSADLLFTVGARAKFFAQGAKRRGFPEDKIFQFVEVVEAGKALQDEIKEGDLILVDGSREMEMGKIVKEIKFVK